VPLLRIDVAHGFFADGRCQGLRFVPVGDTPAWLHASDALVREQDGALAVYGPHDALTCDPAAVLTWHLYADSPDFAHYTDQPAQWPAELLCFDTDQAFAEPAVSDGAWRLHAGATAAATDVRPMNWPLVAQTFSAGSRRHPPWALLRVPLARLPAAPVHYRVRLAVRAMVWKYCLHGDWPEPQLQVVDLASEVAFEEPEPDQLDNGMTLLAIRSQTPIALAQRSTQRFELRSRQRGGDKVLVRRLPVAAAQFLARERIGGASRLVCEIHVHR
jgi:hypothetical protein